MDIVLNSVKHNVDDLYNLPNSEADSKLVELLARTLGFKVKRNYDQNQLKALVAAIPIILKYKGTTTAITMAGNALVAAAGTVGDFSIKEVNEGELTVVFPENLVDITLFVDLLPYILPAGMTCHIMRTNRVYRTYTTELGHQNAVFAEWIRGADINEEQDIVGLATYFNTGRTLFNTGSDIDEFANFQKAEQEDARLLSERFNAGLLDNSIIPALTRTITLPGDTTESTGDNV
jgi:hypothetical protein